MSLLLGSIAPDFIANSTHGPIRFYEWLGEGWGLLFSHPKDYTPVCTTELGVVANLHAEFSSRSVKPIALSVDDVASHTGWIQDIEETMNTRLTFPILDDSDKQVARLYGMVHGDISASFTIRSVFIIGPDKRIRLTLSYPVAVGRNFDEILRVIDALQLSDANEVLTPANWQRTDKVIIDPSIDEADLPKKFPQGYEEVKPYLRYTNLQDD